MEGLRVGRYNPQIVEGNIKNRRAEMIAESEKRLNEIRETELYVIQYAKLISVTPKLCDKLKMEKKLDTMITGLINKTSQVLDWQLKHI